MWHFGHCSADGVGLDSTTIDFSQAADQNRAFCFIPTRKDSPHEHHRRPYLAGTSSQPIDRLDRQLLSLIAERGAYVKQAAGSSARWLRCRRRRVGAGDCRVKQLAPEVGADPAVVEATWRAMISAFIDAETAAPRRIAGANPIIDATAKRSPPRRYLLPISV